MPKFIIERDIPGAGKLSQQEIKAISQKSLQVISGMQGKVQWLHSYVADDKVYCVYMAQNEESVRQHAKEGGFPANKVLRVHKVIDPTAAE
jgi:hypothetical protein